MSSSHSLERTTCSVFLQAEAVPLDSQSLASGAVMCVENWYWCLSSFTSLVPKKSHNFLRPRALAEKIVVRLAAANGTGENFVRVTPTRTSPVQPDQCNQTATTRLVPVVWLHWFGGTGLVAFCLIILVQFCCSGSTGPVLVVQLRRPIRS